MKVIDYLLAALNWIPPRAVPTIRRKRTDFQAKVEDCRALCREANAGRPSHEQLTTNPKKLRALFSPFHQTRPINERRMFRIAKEAVRG